jgi:hypothetical protein
MTMTPSRHAVLTGARWDIGRLLSPLQRPLNQRAAAG